MPMMEYGSNNYESTNGWAAIFTSLVLGVYYPKYYGFNSGGEHRFKILNVFFS